MGETGVRVDVHGGSCRGRRGVGRDGPETWTVRGRGGVDTGGTGRGGECGSRVGGMGPGAGQIRGGRDGSGTGERDSQGTQTEVSVEVSDLPVGLGILRREWGSGKTRL